MLKTNHIYLFLIFVLTFGLASCGGDKKNHIKDVYIPNAVSLEDMKEVDVQNSLDLEKQAPSHYNVASICHSGDSTKFASFVSPDRRSAHIVELLPPEVVLADLQSSTWKCSFRLTLYNVRGSSFEKNFYEVKIVDRLKSPIAFFGANAPGDQHVLDLGEPEQPRLDYVSGEGTSLKLKCSEVESKSTEFDRLLELKTFAWPAIADHEALQSCRFLMSRNNQVVAVSERLDAIFPKPDFEVRPYANERRGDWVHHFEGTSDYISPGGYEIKNLSQHARLINLPQMQLDVNMNSYLIRNGTRAVGFVPLHSKWTPLGSFIQVSPNSFLVEPGKSMTLALDSTTRRLICGDDWYWAHSIIGPIPAPKIDLSYARGESRPVKFKPLQFPQLKDAVLPEWKDINIPIERIRAEWPQPTLPCLMP